MENTDYQSVTTIISGSRAYMDAACKAYRDALRASKCAIEAALRRPGLSDSERDQLANELQDLRDLS